MKYLNVVISRIFMNQNKKLEIYNLFQDFNFGIEYFIISNKVTLSLRILTDARRQPPRPHLLCLRVESPLGNDSQTRTWCDRRRQCAYWSGEVTNHNMFLICHLYTNYSKTQTANMLILVINHQVWSKLWPNVQ